jgi:hypothetical protein
VLPEVYAFWNFPDTDFLNVNVPKGIDLSFDTLHYLGTVNSNTYQIDHISAGERITINEKIEQFVLKQNTANHYLVH